MNTQKSKKAVIRKEIAQHSRWALFLVIAGYIAILNLAHDASVSAAGSPVMALIIAALSVTWLVTVVGIAQDWYNDAKESILDSWDCYSYSGVLRKYQEWREQSKEDL